MTEENWGQGHPIKDTFKTLGRGPWDETAWLPQPLLPLSASGIALSYSISAKDVAISMASVEQRPRPLLLANFSHCLIYHPAF